MQKIIAKLNSRANKLYTSSDLEVVAVCLYVHPTDNFVQAWFSKFDGRGNLLSKLDQIQIAEGSNLEKALSYLDEYLSIEESLAIYFEKCGEKIVQETGFGD